MTGIELAECGVLLPVFDQAIINETREPNSGRFCVLRTGKVERLGKETPCQLGDDIVEERIHGCQFDKLA